MLARKRNFLAHEYPALFIQNLDTERLAYRAVMRLGGKEGVIRFAAHETSIL